MFRLQLAVFLLIPFFGSIAQNDNIGSGRSVSFDGVNDYIDLGDIYHNVNLPFTVSAWIYLDPSLNFPAPIFTTNDNTNFIYRGFWFYISESAIWCEYGDGTGGNNPAYRRGKLASIQNVEGRWLHVSVVAKSGNDVSLYVNGVNVGGSYTGNSSLPMASSFSGDTPKIGSHYSNTTSYKFKGQIDEVRLWNKALSQADIQSSMCKKITGSESGLIGYWTFDETSGNTINDKSASGFNGQLMNSPTRVYSGAPIGDESVFSYQSNWSGKSVVMSEGNEEVKVTNVSGSPEGIHVYAVNDLPSQVVGLDLSTTFPPYFGVFAAATDANNLFDISYSSNGNTSCISARNDNSEAVWINKNYPISGVVDRIEVIKGEEAIEFDISLGEDESFCPFNSKVLSTMLDPTGFGFEWQDGSTQSSLNVTDYGTYWVKVSQGCTVNVDTVVFTKIWTELEIDLGVDQSICPFVPQTLNSLLNPAGFDFIWQDGSTQATFQTSEYGKYWVTVQGECEIGSDTIIISKIELTEFTIDLGEDEVICPFVPKILNPIDNSTGFEFTWQDGSTQSAFQISEYGKYWVTVEDECSIGSDTISISKSELISLAIDLGSDEVICPFIPKELSPLENPNGFGFTWQDGSTESSFQTSEYGKYWVTVQGECEIGSDTIIISKLGLTEFTIELGEDEIICPFVPKILSPIDNSTGFEFTWQDGSKQSTFKTSGFGKYWVTVQNDCVIGSDTIVVSMLEQTEFFIPNVITPNEDGLNQYFVIDPNPAGTQLFVYNNWGKQVYESVNYQNNWDASGLPSGTYYYLLYSECIPQKKGWISVLK